MSKSLQTKMMMMMGRNITTIITTTTITNQCNTNLIRPQCRMSEGGHSGNCRQVDLATLPLIYNCFPGSHYVRSVSKMASLWITGKITYSLV
jgi:hypothetical protein